MIYKKNILFVVPGLKIGGVTSSLSSIYSYLKEEYNISVLSLSESGNMNFSFGDVLLKSKFLINAFYCDFKDIKGWKKVIVFFVKVIKKLFSKIGWDFESFLVKNIFAKLYDFSNYDIVVSFQEGGATKFVAMVQHPFKVAWIHCDYKRAYSYLNELECYNRFNKIVCVSKYTSLQFCDCYPSLQDRVEFVYNLFDYKRVIDLSNIQINDNKFKTDKFTIISVGRVDPIKRFDKIPHIANCLKHANVDFVWYILGPAANVEYMHKINKNIEKYNLSNDVVLLGGQYNPYPYIKQSHLLVCLSSSEACPMIFSEAKILNTSVISSDFGGVEEFVGLGSGLIVNIENMADAIRQVIDNFYKYRVINSENTFIDYNQDIVISLEKLFNKQS